MEINTQQDGLAVLERLLMSEISLSPRNVDKPIILYGAGSLGKMAKAFFNFLNIKLLYFVDKKSKNLKMDEFWGSTEIVHPDEVNEVDKKKSLLIICIVTTPLISLRDELKAQGWKDIAFFYDVCEAYTDRYPLYNGWILKKQNKNEIDSIKDVFTALDEISRKYYLQFIAWRRLRIELLFKDIQIKDNRYFIPEIVENLHENEVFIDCGAYDGTISKKIVELTNGKYHSIYAIEADNDSFVKLEENLKNIPRTKTINIALGDKIGQANFYQGFGYASKLNELGNSSIEISTLDQLNIPATFIKMHLEGAELSSLKGAIDTIKKFRPIIAVTIYHNSDGVYKMPLYLINNTNEYRYSMRLDSWGGTGAVFYAIPEERLKQVVV